MGSNYLSIPKLQRFHRWSLGMDKQFHPTLYSTCDYLSMLGFKLNHVSKRGPSASAPSCWPTCSWTMISQPQRVKVWLLISRCTLNYCQHCFNSDSALGWRAPKTATSATPVSAVTWPRSRFNISGPDPLGFDWEGLAASRGTAGGHNGRPLI